MNIINRVIKHEYSRYDLFENIEPLEQVISTFTLPDESNI